MQRGARSRVEIALDQLGDEEIRSVANVVVGSCYGAGEHAG